MPAPRNDLAWSRNTRARRRLEMFERDPHCPLCRVPVRAYTQLFALEAPEWDHDAQWVGCIRCKHAEVVTRRVIAWLLAPPPKPLYKLSPNGRSVYDDEHAYNRRYNHQRNVEIVRYYHHVCPHCSTFTPELNDWLIYNRYAGCAYCAEHVFDIHVEEQTFGIIDVDGIVDTGEYIRMPRVKPANIEYSKQCKANPANAHYAY